MPKARATLTLAALFLPLLAWAKVDLVTLPGRDRVQITIYNSADLTLVRDVRTMTLRRGENRLQFSWANTLIDPTSLELSPGAGGGEVMDLVFPPRIGDLGIWHIEAERPGSAPMEISYFTSGVSWTAYYLATLTSDERALELRGYVRVQNHSGEDYENAETRLVVGKINLLDRIAELARRRPPYGRPSALPLAEDQIAEGAPAPLFRAAKAELALEEPKAIRKEGLSEYFLYTIEGTEDIPDGWGKRLVSFSVPEVPVRNLYRFEEERYGAHAVRFLDFANDPPHNLGREPIPGGLVKVFRRVDAHRLSYVGAQTTRYVPKGENVRLNLGPTEDVTVEPTLLALSTDNYEWGRSGNNHPESQEITGWDEHHSVKVEVANHRDLPARVEVRRNFPVKTWEIENEGEFGDFERIDADTVQFVLEMPPHSRKEFRYRLTMHMGSRGL